MLPGFPLRMVTCGFWKQMAQRPFCSFSMRSYSPALESFLLMLATRMISAFLPVALLWSSHCFLRRRAQSLQVLAIPFFRLLSVLNSETSLSSLQRMHLKFPKAGLPENEDLYRSDKSLATLQLQGLQEVAKRSRRFRSGEKQSKVLNSLQIRQRFRCTGTESNRPRMRHPFTGKRREHGGQFLVKQDLLACLPTTPKSGLILVNKGD